MTNEEFVAAMEQFARKPAFGHNPEENIVRFGQYEIDESDFMPDLSKYSLELNSFCLLVSHLDINTNEASNDQHRRSYETNVLIVKATERMQPEATKEVITEAQKRGEWLWAAMLHYQKCVETSSKRKGKFLNNLRIGRSFQQNDITGLSQNACGVEIQMSFFEDITHQNIVQKYPDWN